MEIFYFYLISGIVLVVCEIALNTFYLLIVGLVFIIISPLALVVHSWSITSTVSMVLALAACYALRVYKKHAKRTERNLSPHLGKSVEVIEIGHDKLRVSYSGSYWDAKLANKDLQ